MNRLSYYLIVGLLGMLLLSSCQSNATLAPQSTPSTLPAEMTTPAGEAPSYPAPESVSPSSQVQSQVVGNLYPGPSQGNASYVDWKAAESAILAGEVAEIYQDNVLHVTLLLKSGDTMLTIQPAMDEVTKVLERCGDLCKDTTQVAE